MRSHRINRGAIPRRSTAGREARCSIGIVAQTGECLDGIEEVAGAIPADSTTKRPTKGNPECRGGLHP